MATTKDWLICFHFDSDYRVLQLCLQRFSLRIMKHHP